MERKSYLTSKAFKIFLGASILTALSAMLGNIVDGIVVSHLINYDAMSATSICKPLMQGNYTLFQLVGLGASILVAQAMGQNNRRRVNELFTMAIWVLLVFSLLEVFAGILFPNEIVDFFCKNEALHHYAIDYFIPIILGTPICMAVFFLGAFTAIDGAPRLVSYAMVADNLLHLVMDVVLIQFCDMGVMGSSIATLIGHALAVVMMLTHYKKCSYRFQLSALSPQLSALKESCGTGLPFAVASICMTIYLYATQSIIGTTLGKESLFIFSVMLNIMTIYNMFVTGACQTMQQLASLQIGMGDNYGHKMTVMTAFKFLNVSLGIAFLVLLIFPQIIASMFDCPENLYSECCYGVRIYGVAFWLFCNLYLLMVNYKLLKQTSLANFISFMLSLSVIPVMWINAHYLPEYVWWSNLIAYVIVLLCAIIWLRINSRGKKFSIFAFSSHFSLLTLNSSLSTSFAYTKESMQAVFIEIKEWLEKQNLTDATIYKVRVVAEELMLNIISHSQQKNKKAYADVRLTINNDDIILALTDDGVPFSPVGYKDRGYGLTIANGESSEIIYKYQFGQNMTTVRFKSLRV